MSLVRSVSGLRGIIGETLTPQIVVSYAAGFASFALRGKIVVCDDGRPSGKWISDIVRSVLIASGREVLQIGTTPTPTLQIMIESEGAAGGIAVTASHNPGEWNGLKFLNASGEFLDAEENAEFWKIVDSENFRYSLSKRLPLLEIEPYAWKTHADKVLNHDFFREVRDLGYKVVVDAVNASGSQVLPYLLESFGCNVLRLNCEGDGTFTHKPEPLPEHLGELCDSVAENRADLGIAVDPDADRIVFVAAGGKFIGEELSVALATESVLMNFDKLKGLGYEKHAVVNMSSSIATSIVAERYGAGLSRSAVGEISVVREMQRTNAVIGGEGSGGIIMPAIHYGRDSLVGAALVLRLLRDTGESLSKLAARYDDYKIIKTKMPFDKDFNAFKEKVKSAFNKAEFSEIDGIRADEDGAWLHVRRSNTEPVIRIIAESNDEARTRRMMKRAESLITEI